MDSATYDKVLTVVLRNNYISFIYPQISIILMVLPPVRIYLCNLLTVFILLLYFTKQRNLNSLTDKYFSLSQQTFVSPNKQVYARVKISLDSVNNL